MVQWPLFVVTVLKFTNKKKELNKTSEWENSKLKKLITKFREEKKSQKRITTTRTTKIDKILCACIFFVWSDEKVKQLWLIKSEP